MSFVVWCKHKLILLSLGALSSRHEGVEVLSFDTTGGDWTGFERILSGIRDKTNPARLYAESLRGKRILYVTRLFDASPTAADDAAGNVAEVHKVGSQAQALKKRKSSEISSSIVGSDNEGECKGIQRSQSWWFRESAWNDGRRLAEFLAAASEHLPKVRVWMRTLFIVHVRVGRRSREACVTYSCNLHSQLCRACCL